jgi:hypothetical protein
MSANTFWAIVANAMVIGGAVGGGLLFLYIWMTWPAAYRESHRTPAEPPSRDRWRNFSSNFDS